MKPILRVTLVVWSSLLLVFSPNSRVLFACSTEHKSNLVEVSQSIVLEVTLNCQGMCGAIKKATYRIYQDKRGESQQWLEDRVLSTKSAHLTVEQFDQLINWANSDEFQKAKPAYNCKASFIDALYLITVAYNGTQAKEVHLRNYVPGVEQELETPPTALDRIVTVIFRLLSDRDKPPG
jgi:hypothetical protein